MPGFWPDFDQIFDQIFGQFFDQIFVQVFDQGFDQDFGSPKYSVQFYWNGEIQCTFLQGRKLTVLQLHQDHVSKIPCIKNPIYKKSHILKSPIY